MCDRRKIRLFRDLYMALRWSAALLTLVAINIALLWSEEKVILQEPLKRICVKRLSTTSPPLAIPRVAY